MNREGVGLADAQEAPELKKLWRLSFPEDTEEGVAFFFQRVFQPLNCVVFRQEGRPVSMAFLLPAVLHTPEGPAALHYLYAAATGRDQTRGRGLFAGCCAKPSGWEGSAGWRPPASCRRSRDWPPIMPGSATVPFFGPS